MNLFRRTIFLSLAMALVLAGGQLGCGSDGDCGKPPVVGVVNDCTPECVSQSDCDNNQTCLNGGVCACFAGQNGANCSDSSDCSPGETCNAQCQCRITPES